MNETKRNATAQRVSVKHRLVTAHARVLLWKHVLQDNTCVQAETIASFTDTL